MWNMIKVSLLWGFIFWEVGAIKSEKVIGADSYNMSLVTPWSSNDCGKCWNDFYIQVSEVLWQRAMFFFLFLLFAAEQKKLSEKKM